MIASTTSRAQVGGEQGRVRTWFHTRNGARFLNLQTAWFRIAAPKGYAVLTTIGRRTGRRRRSNVRFVVAGDTGYLVSIPGQTNDWHHNLRANPDVRVRIGWRNRIGRAHVPRDENERQTARAAYVDALNWFDFCSSVVNQRGIPSPRRIRELHQSWIDEGRIVVVQLVG
jgi:deazaflavin-dependent oxidoreductase (nitroreductase family)